ncbi:MAG: hypothetical protein JKY15_08035 [Deltaproteobacteria bacterium]|nr:hypothetical protein [Deltaproteobacteria bacterium]
MGFFGLFKKGGPTQKQIDKQVTRLKEQYAKPEYRQMAMDQLFSWGTHECLVGLIGRFKVVVQSPYYDEQEKRWLVDQLVELGEPAKEVLKEFVIRENEVTYPIQALSRLCSKQELEQLLKNALTARSPEDYRSSEGKMELIAALEEYEIPNSSELIALYLNDHHDEVKCIALDVLFRNKSSSVYPRVTQMLGDDTHSARVLRHAAAKVHEFEVALPDNQALAPEVAEDFEVKSGKLSRVNG